MNTLIKILMLVLSLSVCIIFIGCSNENNELYTSTQIDNINKPTDSVEDFNNNVNFPQTTELALTGVPIDLFEKLEIEYFGADGFGQAEFTDYALNDTTFNIGDFYFTSYEGGFSESTFNKVKVIYENKELCKVRYDIESPNYYNLREGDIYYLTAKIEPTDAFINLGYSPLLRKEMTVPALGTYIKNKSDITIQMLEYFNDLIAEQESAEIVEAYYAKINPGQEMTCNSSNCILLILKTKYSDYFIAAIEDIVIRPDGTFSYINISSLSKQGFGYGRSYFYIYDDVLSAMVNQVATRYTYEKLEYPNS